MLIFTPKDLKYLVKHYYPSSRAVINKVQEFTSEVDGVRTLVVNKDSVDSDNVNTSLIAAILKNDFKQIRIWSEKLSDPSVIFSIIYEHIDDFPQQKRPGVIITVAKYSAWNSQVRDRLVNTVACAVEVAGL